MFTKCVLHFPLPLVHCCTFNAKTVVLPAILCTSWQSAYWQSAYWQSAYWQSAYWHLAVCTYIGVCRTNIWISCFFIRSFFIHSFFTRSFFYNLIFYTFILYTLFFMFIFYNSKFIIYYEEVRLVHLFILALLGQVTGHMCQVMGRMCQVMKKWSIKYDQVYKILKGKVLQGFLKLKILNYKK